IGGIASLLDKLPGANQIPAAARAQINDKSFVQTVAIINSMTRQERRFPAFIRGSRKLRIAKGSGSEVQDVNRLLKQFTQMQKMMKRMGGKGGGMMKMMQGMKGMLPSF
ncbi:MAG: signal recognition particle protein, partial [Gammaproteobacteria bacterium]